MRNAKESKIWYVIRMTCSIPFKLIHRVFRGIMVAIIVSALIAGLAAILLALVTVILGAIVGGVVWLCVLFASMILSFAFLALARVFDSDYFDGKETTATTMLNAVKTRGDGLRDLAKDHL